MDSKMDSRPRAQAELDRPGPYPFLGEPVPVREQQWAEEVEVMVSVACITYNHEPYIREAIEGFLTQRTTFRVEVFIHDDASTDSTADIVREYQRRDPHIIRSICQTENQYSQGNRPSLIVKEHLTGKYLAICEGDDYWSDPLKLQKQVLFLEENAEYGLVHSDCDKYLQRSGTWVRNANRDSENHIEPSGPKELFYKLMSLDYKVRTATVLYRHDLIRNKQPRKRRFPMGDTPMWLELCHVTRFKYLNEVTAVYRVLPGSLTKSTSRPRYLRFRLAMMEMRIYYCNEFGYAIPEDVRRGYNNALLRYMIYHPTYEPDEPLFEPTAWQLKRWRRMRHPVLRVLYVPVYVGTDLLRLVYRGLRSRDGNRK